MTNQDAELREALQEAARKVALYRKELLAAGIPDMQAASLYGMYSNELLRQLGAFPPDWQK